MGSNLIRRLPGESTYRYSLRLNGREYRDRITVLIQDYGLTYSEACEVEFGHLFEFDCWPEFAKYRWELRQADKDIPFTIEVITATVNFVFDLNLSIDEVYAAVRPERSERQSVYDKRYRAKYPEKRKQLNRDYYQKHKERLRAKALARYHANKTQRANEADRLADQSAE